MDEGKGGLRSGVFLVHEGEGGRGAGFFLVGECFCLGGRRNDPKDVKESTEEEEEEEVLFVKD